MAANTQIVVKHLTVLGEWKRMDITSTKGFKMSYFSFHVVILSGAGFMIFLIVDMSI